MAFRVEISPRPLNDPDEIVEYIKQRGSFEQAEKWSCAAEYSRVSSEAPQTPVRSGDRLCAIVDGREDPHLRKDRLRVNGHQPQTQSRGLRYRVPPRPGTPSNAPRNVNTAYEVAPNCWCLSPGLTP